MRTSESINHTSAYSCVFSLPVAEIAASMRSTCGPCFNCLSGEFNSSKTILAACARRLPDSDNLHFWHQCNFLICAVKIFVYQNVCYRNFARGYSIFSVRRKLVTEKKKVILFGNVSKFRASLDNAHSLKRNGTQICFF